MKIPVTALVPSPTNPRKIFDEDALKELGESLKSEQLQALLVREIAPNRQKGECTRYEIVCGERRYRAALLAGLKELDCTVKTLSNTKAIEAQLMENNQRTDVHPLEEAQAIANLLKTEEYKIIPKNVEFLAEQIVKSSNYVYDRLKLLRLTDEAQTAFLTFPSRLTAGHAILLARLSPEGQSQALKFLFHTEDYYYQSGKKEPSVRELKGWIGQNKSRPLKNAEFDRRKPLKNLPQAGACDECPKRSEDENECLDTACFNAKTNAHLAASIDRVKSQGAEPILIAKGFSSNLPSGTLSNYEYKEANKGDEGAVLAVVVLGDKKGELGKTVYIIPKPGTSVDAKKEKEQEERRQRKQTLLDIRIEAAARQDAVKYIEEALPHPSLAPISRTILAGAAIKTVEATNQVAMDKCVESFGGPAGYGITRQQLAVFVDGLGDFDLIRFLMRVSTVDELHYVEYNKPDPIALERYAALAGIDLEHVRREARDRLTPKPKAPKDAKKTVQTSGAHSYEVGYIEKAGMSKFKCAWCFAEVFGEGVKHFDSEYCSPKCYEAGKEVYGKAAAAQPKRGEVGYRFLCAYCKDECVPGIDGDGVLGKIGGEELEFCSGDCREAAQIEAGQTPDTIEEEPLASNRFPGEPTWHCSSCQNGFDVGNIPCPVLKQDFCCEECRRVARGVALIEAIEKDVDKRTSLDDELVAAPWDEEMNDLAPETGGQS